MALSAEALSMKKRLGGDSLLLLGSHTRDLTPGADCTPWTATPKMDEIFVISAR